MSVPYARTVMTGTGSPPAGTTGTAGAPGDGISGEPAAGGRPRTSGPPSTSGRALAAAGLGAACFLALPLLIALAVVERRRRGPRRPAAHLGAAAAGAFLAVDLVLWNHTIADVGAGVATVLGNLQVLFVALAA